MKGCWNVGATSFRPSPHETRHFWNRIFFLSGFLWTGPFNPSGEEFQDNAGSVSRLTGFVWTEGRFVFWSMRFQKYPDSDVNVAYKIQLFTLFLVLKTFKLSSDRHFFLRTTNNYFDFSWPHKAIKCLMVLCFLITDQPTEKTRANSRRGRHRDSTYFVTTKYYSVLQECQIFICYWYCCCCI